MNRKSINRKAGIACRITAGFLGVVLLGVTLLMPGTAYASGMVYGSSADTSMSDTSGAITIGGAGTSSSSSSSDDGTITIGGSGSSSATTVTGSYSTDSSSSGLYVKTGSSSSSSTTSSSSSSASSASSSTSSSSGNSNGLVYGVLSAGLFSSSNSFISIEGKTASASTSTSTSSGTSTYSSFRESYNALMIYVYLRQQGFSAASACGVLGNIMRESSFDPTAYNSNGGSYGLFQCLGYLKTKLYAYCSDVTDPLQQTEAMVYDMAPELFVTFGKNANNITYEEFKQLTDPQEAAETWRLVVEQNNYSLEDTQARQGFAQTYYNKWADYDGAGFDVIQEAMKYVGNPYVYGGDSLTSGIDCSHYVCRILRMTGHYNGAYETSAGLRYVGTEVKTLADAQPGDVLCWSGHVAFYICDGYYVAAANSHSGICVGGGDILTKLGGLITIRRIQ